MAEPAPSRESVHRDPYRSFRYRLRIGGSPVAGFAKISTPAGEGVEGTHFGEGIPAGAALTLERGLATNRDLEQWARAEAEDTSGAPLVDVTLAVYSPHGELVATYRLTRARVSSYRTLSGLDSDIVDAVAIECVTLEHEGWERETPPGDPLVS